jgi:hypothetical protein
MAESIGVLKQEISHIASGRTKHGKIVDRLAKLMGCSVEWLIDGKGDAPAWASDPKPEPPPGNQSLDLVGVVAKAGVHDPNDQPSEYSEHPPISVTIPSSWKLIKIDGMSAYPVLYPDQFAIVDWDRAARIPLSPEQCRDLHDNICLIQLDDGRAYIKRFCHQENAPGGYVLSSIDSGRSSPYVPPEQIAVIIPVVGTMYHDPSKPRIKRNHAKTVVVEV